MKSAVREKFDIVQVERAHTATPRKSGYFGSCRPMNLADQRHRDERGDSAGRKDEPRERRRVPEKQLGVKGEEDDAAEQVEEGDEHDDVSGGERDVLNARRSTTGCSATNSSTITKSRRASAATVDRTRMKSEWNQSSRCPLSTTIWSAPIQTVRRAIPQVSTFTPPCRFMYGGSWMNIETMKTANSPIGMLT